MRPESNCTNTAELNRSRDRARAVIKLNDDPDVEASAFGLSLKDPVSSRDRFKPYRERLPPANHSTTAASSLIRASRRRSARCTASTLRALTP